MLGVFPQPARHHNARDQEQNAGRVSLLLYRLSHSSSTSSSFLSIPLGVVIAVVIFTYLLRALLRLPPTPPEHLKRSPHETRGTQTRFSLLIIVHRRAGPQLSERTVERRVDPQPGVFLIKPRVEPICHDVSQHKEQQNRLTKTC